MDNFPTSWRVLGLSVAASFAGLGSIAIFMPKTAADQLGLRSNNSPQAARVANDAMVLLGARDLSIATALFAFYYQERPHAMGTVILSSMVLCVVDVVWVTMLREDLFGPLLGVGAAVWTYIGFGLLKF